MTSLPSDYRHRGAVFRASLKAAPSLPLVVGLCFLSMGVLALALALDRA